MNDGPKSGAPRISTELLDEIGPISVDLKLNSLTDIKVSEGTYLASMRATFVWRLPKGLWSVLCSTDEEPGPDTGTEVAHVLDTAHEWPRFDIRGIYEYRLFKCEVGLVGRRPNGDFRGLHLPLEKATVSQRTSKQSTPVGDRGFEDEGDNTVLLNAAPGDERDQVPAGGGTMPPLHQRPILAPTSSELSGERTRREGAANSRRNSQNLQFDLRGTSNFSAKGSVLMPDDEVFVKLKLTWVGAEIVTADLGDESWDLMSGSWRHPFDVHPLVFAIDMFPPSKSAYAWPGRVDGEYTFTDGWSGWAWQPGGERGTFAHSNFHRSVCRMFPSENKWNQKRSHRRRWQRLSLPTFTANPTKARWSQASSGVSPAEARDKKKLAPAMHRSMSSGHDYHGPPACQFSFVVEHDAPSLLIFQEIVKPMFLVMLGACKYKVPVDEVADRASIDFVLLLVLYEASDVGLPGVFDLLDGYTHFCLLLLWVSALETFFAEKWYKDDEDGSGGGGSDAALEDESANSRASDMDFLRGLALVYVAGNFLFVGIVYFFKADSGEAPVQRSVSSLRRVLPSSFDGDSKASLPRITSALSSSSSTTASSTSTGGDADPQQQLQNLSPASLTTQQRGGGRPLAVIRSSGSAEPWP